MRPQFQRALALVTLGVLLAPSTALAADFHHGDKSMSMKKYHAMKHGDRPFVGVHGDKRHFMHKAKLPKGHHTTHNG